MTTRKTSSPPQKAELLQGTLDMLVLRTLRRAPCHGHGIGLAIQADSGNLLRIEAGSLYPALHRLERRGWVSSEWKASEKNQRAKYYRLTPRGRKQLVFRESKWDLLVEAVARVRQPPGTEAL